MKKLIYVFLFSFLGIVVKAQTVTFALSDTNVTICSGITTAEFKYDSITAGLDSFLIESSTPFLKVAATRFTNDSLIIVSGVPANISIDYEDTVYYGKIRAFNNIGDTADIDITITILPAFTPGRIQQMVTSQCMPLHYLQASNLYPSDGGDGAISYKWILNDTIAIETNDMQLRVDTIIKKSGTYVFKRIAKDGLCSGGWDTSRNEYRIEVFENFTSGTLSGGDTVCYQGTTNQIITVSDASGGDGNFSYQWIKEHNSTIDTIPNAIEETYTPLSNQSGVFVYKRLEKDGTCASGWGSSGEYTLKVLKDFTAGSIETKDTAICLSAFSYIDIYNEIIATGGDSIISYRWKMNGNPIDSGINASLKIYPYTIASMPGVYTFTREAKDTKCSNGWQSSDNSYTLTVYDVFNAGNISGSSTVCYQGTTHIASKIDASGGDERITYLWTREHENIIDTIQGAESETYTTVSSNQSGTFVYERLTKDSTCQMDWVSSGTYTLTVYELFDAGSITRNNDTVCYQEQVNVIDSYYDVSGGNGVYTYQWTKNNIVIGVGATSDTYMPPSNQSGTFVYKRYAKNDFCATGWVLSQDSSIVTIRQEFKSGSITTANQEVCKNAQAATIANSTSASGGDEFISYRWLSNTDTVVYYTTDPFYLPATDSSGTFLYTRYAKDSVCSSGWKQSSGVQVLIVNPSVSIPSKPIGETSICQGTASESYSVNADNELFRYGWNLFPAAAGTIINNQNIVSVTWNKGFFGTAYLSARAFTSCDTSTFSDTLVITVHQKPFVNFLRIPNPVCANRSGAEYVVEQNNDYRYHWSVDITKGSIIGASNSNSVIIDWDKEISGNTYISLTVTDQKDCVFDTTIVIYVSQGVTPDANTIVAKINQSGDPYILIYPNPVSTLTYQWYKNDEAIIGATRQFYYPSHTSLETSIDMNAKYKVYITYANNSVCGVFSEDYTPVKGKSTKDGFSLDPNPSQGNVNITFIDGNMDLTQIHLSIYSMEGRLVYEEQISNQPNIQRYIPASSGTYIVKARDINGQEFTKKLIIQ